MELDEALVEAFPGPEPIRVLVVGGACLLLCGVTTRPTKDVDVIVTDLLGEGEASLVMNLDKTTRKLRKTIESVGKRHGLRGAERCFLNDDCAPFLRELGEIPSARLLLAYKKLHLYVPEDLAYILACKLMAGRPAKDDDDIAVLLHLLDVHTRERARRLVNRYFPDLVLQYTYGLSKTLDRIFGTQPER